MPPAAHPGGLLQLEAKRGPLVFSVFFKEYKDCCGDRKKRMDIGCGAADPPFPPCSLVTRLRGKNLESDFSSLACCSCCKVEQQQGAAAAAKTAAAATCSSSCSSSCSSRVFPGFVVGDEQGLPHVSSLSPRYRVLIILVSDTILNYK
ncbi:hypothetical protein Esti_006831 [Eimeria stiedai]